MADLGRVEAELNGLPVTLRPIFFRIFQTILKDLRLGHPTFGTADPSTNFGGGFFHGTTDPVANTEFSVTHGFGRTPYLAVPVLPLDSVGSRLVPLTVTRVADARRIYLSSSVTSAPFSLFVEG